MEERPPEFTPSLPNGLRDSTREVERDYRRTRHYRRTGRAFGTSPRLESGLLYLGKSPTPSLSEWGRKTSDSNPPSVVGSLYVSKDREIEN